MSQSSIEEQAKELGLEIKKGTPILQQDKTADPKTLGELGSKVWIGRWAKNAAKNYQVVSQATGIRWLSLACKDVPAFIVGVGPSLDQSIKDLKMARGRAIVIATDAAVRALLANGIRPNLVVSYDCKQEQKVLWETVPDTTIPMLFNSCTHPDSIASWPGPVLFFNQWHQQDELCHDYLPVIYPELGQIPSAGTVGNMAVLAAHALGCKPIMTVGMDFSYAKTEKGWRYRAQDYRFETVRGVGVPHGWEKTEIKTLYDNDDRVARSLDVTVDGKEFKTDPELRMYLEAFTGVVGNWKVPVVDCTPNGMIPAEFDRTVNGEVVTYGIEKLSIPDAITKYCGAELQPGRHILNHLGSILKDPRPRDERPGV